MEAAPLDPAIQRRRRRLRLATTLLAVTLLASSCDGTDADRPSPEPPSPTASPTDEPSPSPAAEPGLDFDAVETVAGGLEVPWALAFPDERTILVTERPGRIRLIRDGRLLPEPVARIDVAAEGEGGLLGLALHPDYPDEPFAYVYSTTPSGNRVSRFRLTDEFAFRDEEVILDGIPAAIFHDGGRIAFGPDGMLYVATGDALAPERAPDRSSLAGKFLRLTPEGRIPDDNPFGDSPVFSYGHRNPQGFDWDDAGRLYSAEHGPTGEFDLCCLDEINLVKAGRFYGWPFRAGSKPAAGGEPPERPVNPIAESGPDTAWAPAGLVVHQPQDGPTELLVATLVTEQLLRFVLEDGTPKEVVRVEIALDGFGRLRSASFGPDGCLYVTTSNTDGRGEPRPNDDRVLRVCASADG